MEQTVIKEGKALRLGYTTGSCATAAAKAAAYMLLTGQQKDTVSLVTPKGIALTLAVQEITRTDASVSCAIVKDCGDDPDITGGALIFAEVKKSDTPGITIDGGFGVGRVTKPGLDQSVGNAAINSTPRRMITENLLEVCRLLDYHGGLSVTISVPLGEELAKKTFNPRLGIVGGISILGTTGIVDPMSEKALVDTIRVELRQRREQGAHTVLITPGNYGSDFIRMGLALDPKLAVLSSNYIGDALDICKELGFSGVLLVGHIGKLVKLAGGMLNTHSKYGDCRMEILAAHAGALGLPPQAMGELLNCAACDEALRILQEHNLQEHNLQEQTLAALTEKIDFQLNHRGAPMEVGAMVFSKQYGLLCQTKNAPQLLQRILEENT